MKPWKLLYYAGLPLMIGVNALYAATEIIKEQREEKTVKTRVRSHYEQRLDNIRNEYKARRRKT